MASPLDVAGLMAWLSTQLQIWLPTLANLGRWPFMQRIWGFVVPGGLPTGDPPWEITLDPDDEVEVLGVFQISEMKIHVSPRTQSGSVQ